MRIAVIGLGRIGSQLLRELGPRFPGALGLDLDPDRVTEARAEGLNATTAYEEASGRDVYLIAVSTGSRMERLLAAISAIEPADKALISIESTLIPGTMARVAATLTERGLIPGRNLHLVHTPHRILFGEEKSIFEKTRIIGGITPACLTRGVEFYQPLVPGIRPCHDIRLVELTKIVENAVRHVEISCAEALSLYCHEAGLDFEELRQLVETKGNVRLLKAEYGIGGECLPKDVKFLYDTTGCQLLADAMAIDLEYRNWLFREAQAPRVLVRGLTFKPGWPDLGYSRAVELVRRLSEAGCQVWVEDPLFSPEELESMGYTPWHPGHEVDTIVAWGKVSKGGTTNGAGTGNG